MDTQFNQWLERIEKARARLLDVMRDDSEAARLLKAKARHGGLVVKSGPAGLWANLSERIQKSKVHVEMSEWWTAFKSGGK